MAQGKEPEGAAFPMSSDRLKASVVISGKGGRKRGKERGGEIQQIRLQLRVWLLTQRSDWNQIGKKPNKRVALPRTKKKSL